MQTFHDDHRNNDTSGGSAGDAGPDMAGDALRVGELLQATWDTAADAMVLSDPDGIVLSANQAYYDLYGLTPAESIGQEFDLIFPGEVREWARLEYRRSFSDAAIAPTVQSSVRRRDGARREVESRYAFVCQDGQRLAMLSTIRDITERVRAELRLRFLADAGRLLAASLDYEATLQNVVHLIVPDLADWCDVHLVTADGGVAPLAVAHGNPARLATARELQQRYPFSPETDAGFSRVIATGEAQLLTEIPDAALVATAQDDEHLRLLRSLEVTSLLCVPLLARERILGALTLAAAESGRRYTADDLVFATELARLVAVTIDNARLYHAAQAAIAARDQLAENLAHDLNGPLTTVKGMVQLLVRRSHRLAAPEATRLTEGLALIEGASTQMSHLVSRLLDGARLQSGAELALTPRPTDLVALVREAVGVQSRLGSGPVLSVDATVPTLIGDWDTAQIERVVANLLSNAVKYSPDRGAIMLRLQREGDATAAWGVLIVQDSGVGIPAADLPHIFNRFHRATNVVNRFRGSGIGLAGTKQMVELHGGSITLASTEGVGTTVTVRLPLSVRGQAEM